jgi:bifunctional non-homologous end joining protein LigD
MTASRSSRGALVLRAGEPVEIPADCRQIEIRIGRRSVRLTNLGKIFFPERGLTKRDLLQHYADLAPSLLPHLRERAMVMKRYPNGIRGKWFFMKRTPKGAPEWLRTCEIEHASGNVIRFPVVQDAPTLLWLVNLGCIDLNPWYTRCDDVDRPDFLNFDLDPVPPATFGAVRETALLVRDRLRALGAKSYAKTSGSKGIHIYVPIVRGPEQKQVWSFAKRMAVDLATSDPKLVTAEYRVARRPAGRVLVDYNQNAWGRTLASVYSVRPRAAATVSMPVTWEEIEEGIDIEAFDIGNAVARVRELGDLWKPLLGSRGRWDVTPHLPAGRGRRSAKAP